MLSMEHRPDRHGSFGKQCPTSPTSEREQCRNRCKYSPPLARFEVSLFVNFCIVVWPKARRRCRNPRKAKLQNVNVVPKPPRRTGTVNGPASTFVAANRSNKPLKSLKNPTIAGRIANCECRCHDALWVPVPGDAGVPLLTGPVGGYACRLGSFFTRQQGAYPCHAVGFAERRVARETRPSRFSGPPGNFWR